MTRDGAAHLRELAGDAADGAGGAGYEHHVALMHVRDVEQADVGGESRNAERAEIGRRTRRRRRIDDLCVLRVEEREFAPAEVVHDRRADRHLVAAGCDHLAHRPAVEHLTDLERRHVALHVVHPPAHVRIDRQVRVADQHLTRTGLGHLGLDEREVRRCRPANRSAGEVVFTSGPCGHRDASRWLHYGLHLTTSRPRRVDSGALR